ncbi:MAG: FAD-dependent oxidoreductase [Phycisphaeraceae bacterium]
MHPPQSHRRLFVLLLLTAMVVTLAGCARPGRARHADVVVFGGTPGGIAAAVAAAREGKSVVLLEPTGHVGGMSTSGLNRDEAEHMARDQTFGGLADRFFAVAAERSGSHPNRKAKVWQSRVAERVFLEMLEEAGVVVVYEQRLGSVEKKDAHLTNLRTTAGRSYHAEVYIDASYEGDLLAAAGVSYATGREARNAYDESLAGVRYTDEPISVSPLDADGGPLPGVMPGPPPEPGSASPHPTPYNIRLNLTTDPDNAVPIDKPERYDPKQYELLARCIQAGLFTSVGQIIGRYGMPGGKVEINNRQQAVVSISLPGEQTPWAEATYTQRDAIHRAYRDYTHGLLWLLKTDPRVPQAMRDDMSRYGFCRDEWVDNDHWPWQLYVREARRMRGAYLMTQHDVTTERTKPDAIHLGSHFIDSHHATRYAVDGRRFVNEGRLWQRGAVYQFPYRAITPRQNECDNLLVPVCVSATHVAFCSIRVEASWMMLGEAAGIAASLAVEHDQAVQAIDIPALQAQLRGYGIPVGLPSDR